jgi:FemAB-related protein (PEP-CTERM system-associated)
MQTGVSLVQENHDSGWDRFATDNVNGCVYHLPAWGNVIARSYSHETDYLIATLTQDGTHVSMMRAGVPRGAKPGSTGEGAVLGILPLVHIRHWLFGNSLVSMPFCDAGGVLAAEGRTERILVEHGLRMADELGVPVLELRQYQPLACMDDRGFSGETSPQGQREVLAVPGWRVSMTAGNKVRMLIGLPETPNELMQSFKAKLRSQIRKPVKDGLTVKVGSVELLDDFYDIFAANMRDLGSPVHSRQFILQILLGFPERAKVFVVYGNGIPMACSMTLGFNGILSNPWASSLRRYGRFAPNMLLYWSMLEYACQQGYATFDFGRSTVDEGTYRFKEQWGAKPAPLYWYRFSRDSCPSSETTSESRWMIRASECWKRLPVRVTRVLGPRIRQYISL